MTLKIKPYRYHYLINNAGGLEKSDRVISCLIAD